jgi:hypothetical protein
MILATHGIISSYVGVDTDAQAFITAANITNTTQQNAIKTLVSDLKSYGVWTKMKAIYPFVGGTASSHRFNLKAPTTNTSDFYLSFIGGWTHSSTGVLPNGSTSYAETNLTPSSVLSQNNLHISYYSRTNTNTGNDIAAKYSNGDPAIISLAIRTSGNSYSRFNDLQTEGVVTNSNGTGYYILSRTQSTTYSYFKNNLKTTIVKTSDGNAPQSILLGAISFTGTLYYGNKESAFVTIGDGLTDTDATNLYNSVNAYQVALSRNV